MPRRKRSKYFSFDDAKHRHSGAFSHHTDHPRDCAYCGTPMTSSDVNDYGTLCRRCYMKEYYGREED